VSRPRGESRHTVIGFSASPAISITALINSMLEA